MFGSESRSKRSRAAKKGWASRKRGHGKRGHGKCRSYGAASHRAEFGKKAHQCGIELRKGKYRSMQACMRDLMK